jgi:hypothetical protein
MAASQKQSMKAQDRNPSQSEVWRFAKHTRYAWETVELLADERRMAGFDFVDGAVISVVEPQSYVTNFNGV